MTSSSGLAQVPEAKLAALQSVARTGSIAAAASQPHVSSMSQVLPYSCSGVLASPVSMGLP